MRPISISLRICGVAAILVSTLTAQPSWAAGPSVRVGRAAAPPKVDGKLDYACWGKAAVLMPFLRHDGMGLAGQQTIARVCWDASALYLGIECFERALSPATQQLHLLKRKVTAHDGPVYGDESIELFLRPNGKGDYYQLGANILGTRYEARGTDPSFNGIWQAATTTTTTAWYLEVAIPFESLGVAAPKAGDAWTLNICRNRHPETEHSTWSGLQGAFHTPEMFGQMVFADAAVAVRLADTADLSPAAPALRLEMVGLEPGTRAEVQVKTDRVRRSRAVAGPGSATVSLRYPLSTSTTPPQMRYQVVLPGGAVAYRSPWFSQSGTLLDLTGTVLLKNGSGSLLLNGEEVVTLAAGQPTKLTQRLKAGDNVLAVSMPGGSALSGTLRCGDQTLTFHRGWRWSATPAEGWDKPGFDAEPWKPLPSPVDGAIALPAAERIHLRRVLAVSDRTERFWPLQADLNLPRGSTMFVKPLLGWAGDPPPDYTYVLDLPAPIRIVAHDNLDGAALKSLTSKPVTRDGQAYTRYRLRPVGTLTGGFTLEVVWRNASNTSYAYVSAFSLGGTFDWRDFQIELTSPSYAAQVHLLCLKWQKRGIYGTCWYDDIQLIEKGTTKNLVPQCSFEGPEWKKEGHGKVHAYTRDGTPNHAVRLKGTKQQVGNQTGLWVARGVTVKPNTRYVIRMRAKGIGIVAQGGVSRACLLADVGSPKRDRLTAYSHYEGLDGHVVEAERATPIHILPAMKRRAPKKVPIIACYASAAYENPAVSEATARMVLDAGINWLWGSNQGPIADIVRPHGVKFVWHIPRHGYHQTPIDADYLTRHPGHAALQKNGAKSPREICPTVLLDMPNEFMPRLKAWFIEKVRANPYDLIDWDHEFPVDRISSICLCPRCRKAFAAWAKLPSVPSFEDVFAKHEKQWISFRCHLNVRMAKVLRDACKAANPAIPFSVYSGYQTARTHATYGVDWAQMREAIDWAIAGYSGTRATIQHTMKALGDVPFTTGCMYVEKRFRAERPYPTPTSWRIRLLRATLDDEGMGFLVWYLPVLDGAGYWGIGWVAALVADFEPFFTPFRRDDSLVEATPELDASSLAVLTKGNERLIIVMNAGRGTRDVTLRLKNVPRSMRLVAYETGKRYNARKPLSLSQPAGSVDVFHLKPR